MPPPPSCATLKRPRWNRVKLHWLFLLKNKSLSSCFLSPLRLCMVKHYHTSVNSQTFINRPVVLDLAHSNTCQFLNTILYPTVIHVEHFLSHQLNSGTHYLITLDLLKTSALLKLTLKLFFLRERLICISQMFYSFHFTVIVFHLFQLIFFPCIFKLSTVQL